MNPSLPTGEIEIGDCTVEVLSVAEPPPFPIDERADQVDETVRLRYRYLDLRRERMQRNLRIRSTINSAVRAAMERQGFVEVETPMLMASTPEGAREFLVPSRQQPGSFYALPQSPQLFKQLLMVGGIDRYYQIARCLRDEDLRADRQYEFMQLDAEASFVDQEDVLEFISEAVLDAAEAVLGDRPPPIEQITWHDAMDRFGVDKPDLRFGIELVELTPIFAGTEFKAFAGAAAIKGIGVPGRGDMTRNQLDSMTDRAKSLGAKGLVWMRVGAGGALESPVVKFLSETEKAALVAALSVAAGGSHPHRRRRVDDDLRGARPAAQRPGAPARVRGPVPICMGRRLPDVRRRERGRASEARTSSVHAPASRRHRSARVRSDVGAQPQRTTSCSTGGSSVRARSGSTSPSCSSASSTCWASGRRRPARGSASS